MRDIVFHLADGQMRACFEAFFSREQFHASLGCGAFDVNTETDILQIPGKTDPSLYDHAHENLEIYKSEYNYAMVVLDRQWNDSSKTPLEIERNIVDNMLQSGWVRERFEVIVIDPELEAWMFQENENFLRAFRYYEGTATLRDRLDESGYWPKGQAKPADPKAAIGMALHLGKSNSRTVLFKNVCSRISVRGCTDTAFVKFRETLQRWFPAVGCA